MTELCDLSASELLRLYASKEVSPVDVTRDVLQRSAAIQPVLNAFCRIDEEGALATAREAERNWQRGAPTRPLEGIPVSIKDNQSIKGWVMGRGSRMSDHNPPADTDAPTVARLRAAGAVIFANTTLCEGGWKAVTDSPRTGITRNPHDPQLTPGGSSGGAVVAVAAGAGPLALGSDGGGSIRIPASFTGLYGLKPTYGRVPQFPLSIHYTNMSHTGPITRTVDDAALMLQVLAGQDPRDPDTLPDFPAPLMPLAPMPLAGLKIGVTEDFGFMRIAPDVSAVFRDVVRVLESAGAIIETVPNFEDWRPTYRTLWEAGAWQAHRRIDPAMKALIDPEFLAAGAAGSKICTGDYLDAVMRRIAYRQENACLHERVDFVLSPAVAVPPFRQGVNVPDDTYDHWLDWAAISQLGNLTGQPAASFPAGFTAAGIPIGIQIAGRPNDDIGVLQLSHALEQIIPNGRRLPSAVMMALAARPQG